jgi:hypothetical protein
MPIQKIVIPKFAVPLWEAVQQRPVEMTEDCLKSRSVKVLLNLGLVVYEKGVLCLMKDC